ncbi:hypothetical protein SAMN04487894_10340 [Niabella drilacis]|uniref:Quinol monooxygenase YgiN n=2 Tax=Niabella drilacis (strain DSM 25811 / CCM 8410 / CCUG 62505 / LMG 26954 / E90) TaxID=1285928 RepID=A0A1G6MU73_NIADE|nr:hypothetical protein SAMN04487894_10340 [Niabella drilacis]
MTKAYLQISMNIPAENRETAAAIYRQYLQPFLNTIKGAQSKELLVRAEGLQVLHGFETTEDAQAYLMSDLFNKDVVTALKPCLQNNPDIRIYSVV